MKIKAQSDIESEKVRKREPLLSTARNKELTKERIVSSAISLIHEEGLRSLCISKVALRANRSRRMIYDYYGGLEGLMIEVVARNDFWVNSCERIGVGDNLRSPVPDGEELLSFVESYLRAITKDHLQQDINCILFMEDYSDVRKQVNEIREKSLMNFFNKLYDGFGERKDEIKCVLAIMMGGLEHIAMYSKLNDNTYMGLNPLIHDDREKLIRAVKGMIGLLYHPNGPR